MGVVQQLKLLFKKNYILRKRQPGILALEVLWPIFIVIIVAVIRQGVPPEEKGTCHYQERAMPSAGVVPFLQTFVCNLDNKCQDETHIQTAQEVSYRLSALVGKVAPYIGSDNTVKALESMDVGVTIVKTLNNLLVNNTIIEEIEESITVRSLLRDPQKVKKVLMEEYGRSEEVVDAILNSTLNLMNILDLVGYNDVVGIVCTPDKLKRFLLFKNGVDIKDVSSDLCALDVDKIPEITQFLQGEIDIAEIVRLMGLFEKFKDRLNGGYKLSDAFKDIADMMDLVLKSPSVSSAIKAFSSIKDLPDIIRKLPKWLDMFSSASNVFKPIQEMLVKLDPIVQQLSPGDVVWKTVNSGLNMANNLTDVLNGNWNGTSEDLVNVINVFLDNMESTIGNMSTDATMILQSLSSIKLGDIFTQSVEGTIMDKEILDSLDQFQETLEKTSLWNTTGPIISLLDNMMHMFNLTLRHTLDLEDNVVQLLSKGGPIQTSLDRVLSKGPNITRAVLDAFTDSKALQKVFENLFSYSSLCDAVIDKIREEMDSETADQLGMVLCNNDTSTAADSFVSNLNMDEIQRTIDETVQLLTYMMNQAAGKYVPVKLSTLYLSTKDMIETSTMFVSHSETSWKRLFDGISTTGIQQHQREWYPVVDMLNENYVGTSILAMARALGKAMYSEPLLEPMSQYVHMSEKVVEYTYKQMKHSADMFGSDSTMGKLVRYGSQYAPELTEGITKMMSTQPEVMYELIESEDVFKTVCADNWMDKMEVPYYVPMAEIENIVCNTDWDVMVKSLSGVVSDNTYVLIEDMSTTAQEIGEGRYGDYNMSMDWIKLMDYTERSVDFLSDEEKRNAFLMGTGNLFLHFNLTQVEKALQMIGDAMAHFSINDLTRITDIAVLVMKEIDRMTVNNTQWNEVKFTMIFMDHYLDLQNSYFKHANSTNTLLAMLNNYPEEFKEIVIKGMRLMPKLLLEFRDSILHVDKLFKKIDNGQIHIPDCEKYFVSDYLIDEDNQFHKFEKEICSKNWTAIAIQLGNTPEMKKFNDVMVRLNTEDVSTLKVNWTSLARNMDRYVNVMNDYMHVVYSADFNWLPLNLTALDMSWSQFVRGMETLKNVDSDKLMKLLLNIQLLFQKLQEGNGTTSEGMSVLNGMKNTIDGQLYLTNAVYQFFVTQLENFNASKEVYLMEYIGSNELTKIVSYLEKSPEIFRVILNTLARFVNVQDNSYLDMTKHIDQFCQDETVVRNVFDLRDGAMSPASLQNIFCGMEINATVLLEEVTEDLPGFKTLVDDVNYFIDRLRYNEGMDVNYTAIVENYTKMSQLLVDLIESKKVFHIFNSTDWENETVYVEEWNSFNAKINATMNRLISDPRMMIKWNIGSVITSQASQPYFNEALHYIDAILDLNANLSTMTIEEEFKGFPRLVELITLIDDLPEVLEVIVYTSLVNPEKFSEFIANIFNIEQFCMNPSVYFESPVELSYNISVFLEKACSINITMVAIEAESYKLVDMSKPVDLPKTVDKLTDLLFMVISGNGSLGLNQRIFNETLYINMIQRVEGYFNQTAFMSPESIFKAMQQIYTTSTPLVRQSLSWIPSTLTVVDAIMDKILALADKNSFNLRELFPDAPEIKKLIMFIQEPGVLEMMLSSANSYKIQPLWQLPNATEALMLICDPRTDMKDYLVEPADVDVNSLRDTFCQINITNLVEEFNKEFNVDEVEEIDAGRRDIDWLAIGKKYTEISELFERWAQTPPTLVLPDGWDNGTYWLNILNRYNAARQTPAAINQEIETLMKQLTPLMNMDGFREYGLIMETVLRLMNENFIGLQNQQLTVRNMLYKIPILKEIMAAAGIKGDILDALLVAPVKDPEYLVRVLTEQAMNETVCGNASIWHVILELPESFDTSPLHGAFCSVGDRRLVDNLVQNLDLDNLITSLKNRTIQPDWTSVFNQSQMLGQNIESFLKQLPTFNASDVSAMLAEHYNETNLWNMLRVYSTMSQTLQMQLPGANVVIKGSNIILKYLNDLMEKLKIGSSRTLNLAALFEGSPTFKRVMDTFLDLSPDPVTALIGINLKVAKSMEFGKLFETPEKLNEVFCSESKFNEYFLVPDGFNTTIVVKGLCNVNFTDIAEELIGMADLIPKFENLSNNSTPLDIQEYTKLTQEFSQHIISLLNVTDVTFDGRDLEKIFTINGTVLEQSFLKLLEATGQQYSTIPTELFNNFMKQMSNVSEWREVMGTLSLVDVYLKNLNQNLRYIKDAPFSLELLVNRTEIGPVLMTVLLKSEWLEELANIQLKPNQLLQMISNSTAEDLCGEKFWDAFILPPNNETKILKELQSQICSVNDTVVLWQTIYAQVQGYQFHQQVELVKKELAEGRSVMFNMTELDKDMRDTINLLTEIISGYISGNQTVGTIVDINGFEEIFNKLHGVLGEKLMNMSSAWSVQMMSLSLKQAEDAMPSVSRVLETMNIFLELINDRLKDVKDGNISLATLLANSAPLMSTVETLMTVTKYSTKDWLGSNIDLYNMADLFTNESLREMKCADNSLTSYITNTTATPLVADLGKLVCSLQTLPEAFKQFLDYEKISKRFADAWDMDKMVKPASEAYSKNIQLFNQYITELITSKPTVDSQLKDLFNMDNILKMVEDLFTNPTLLVNILKPYGKMLEETYSDNDDFKTALSSINNNLIIPVTRVFSVLQENGLTIQGMLSDHHQLLEAIEILSRYENSVSITMGLTFNLLTAKLTNNQRVVKNLLCNATTLRSRIEILDLKDFDGVQQVLCNNPSSSWFEKLENLGMKAQHILDLATLLSSVYSHYSCYEQVITDPVYNFNYTTFTCSYDILDRSITVNQLLSSVAKLSNLVIVDSRSNGTRTVNHSDVEMVWKIVKNAVLQSTINGFSTIAKQNEFSSYNAFGDDWMPLKHAIQFINSFETFINNYLQAFTDSKMAVKIGDILPDSQRVADLLKNILSPTSAAEFVTMIVDPQRFASFAFSDRWPDMVCNETLFNETFWTMNETGVDVQAIQTELCEQSKNTSNSLNELANLVQAKDVMRKLNEFLIHGHSNITANLTMWYDFEKGTERLLTNLETLTNTNVNTSAIMTWFQPILKTLTSLNNPTMNSVNDMCKKVVSYTSNSAAFEDIQPLLVSVVSTIKRITLPMTIFDELEDITCDVAENFDLMQLFDKLDKHKVFEVLNWVTPPLNSSFDCDEAVSTIYNLYDTLNKTMTTSLDFKRLGSCLSESATDHFGSFLKGVDSAFELTTEFIELIQKPKVKDLLKSIYPDLQPILEYALGAFKQQRTVAITFSAIFENATSLMDYFNDVLKIAPIATETLFKSTINLDPRLFLNESVSEIQQKLCDPYKLANLIQLPNFTQINYKVLSDMLCKNGSTEAAVAIKSAADAARLVQSLVMLSGADVNQEWLKNISDHTATLIGDLEEIGSLASLLGGGLNVDAIRKDIPKIDKFMMGSGPDKLVRSISAILDDLRFIFPNNESQGLIGEVSTFMRGFMGLDLIQSRIISAVNVGDLLKDPVSVQRYMVSELGFTKEMAETVLSGTYSVRVFLNATMNNEDMSCSRLFNDFIILNKTAVTYANLTAAFCSLNETTGVSLTERLLPELNIGDWVKMYVTSSAESILKSANITMEEANYVTETLSKSQVDLQKAASILEKTNDTFEQNILDQMMAPQAQVQQLSSLEPLLCGGDSRSEKIVNEALDVTNFLSMENPKLKESELNALPSDFCRDIYREIMSKQIGSVIWAYLKPIMRGKILFSPNTEMSRRIIEGASGMFNVLKDVRRVAKAWTLGAPELKVLMSQAKSLPDMKKIVNNQFVQSMLESTSGVNAASMMEGLEALNSDQISMGQMDGIKQASELLLNYTECMDLERFIGFDTEEELVEKSKHLSLDNQLLAGIVFTNLPTGSRRKRSVEELPKHIIYKIRMDSDNVQTTRKVKDRLFKPGPDDDFADDLRYMRGFVQLQDMIEKSIISLQTGDNSSSDPGVFLKQFPYPCHLQDTYIHYLGSYLLPVLMTFAWLAALGIATRNLVNDRENGQEETLKLMGMNAKLSWLTWLLSTMILMIFVSIIITLILKFAYIFTFSNVVIIFLYLMAFCFSSTMLCYMVSAFITRTTIAILTVLIVYFLSYLPYIVLVSMGLQMEFWQKIIACLSCTTAFSFGAQYLAMLEEISVGIQWNNLNQKVINGDAMTFNWSCIMMLIDSAIYLLIGWYIRNVKPGKYGVSRPLYFFLLPSYWCNRRSRSSNELLFDDISDQNDGVLFQKGKDDLHVGISTQNLRKVYNNSTTAVHSLNLKLYENQVTALLGHNGAAKTTTMNMISGVLEPTSGTVQIYNKSPTDCSGILGICPQHNAIFDFMTVYEHMEFYSGVKCGSVDPDEIRRLLRDVSLWHVKDVPGRDLSGGMQRRLCVALAFVGQSSAIILDEPTSGVDPFARKNIWNFILKQKIGRTILISTHHLDEADILGDRIAILHTGKLLCTGTPVYLKALIGSGLTLTVDKKMLSPSSGSTDASQTSRITEFIQSHHPAAKLIEEAGTELEYKLPRTENGKTAWAQFFDQFDQQQSNLQISSYGVSDTTLEEVFLKVTTIVDDGKEVNMTTIQEVSKERRLRSGTESNGSDTSSQGDSETAIIGKQKIKKGCGLSLQQLGALLVKRFHHYRRDWRMIISALILPVLFFLVAIGFSTLRPQHDNLPSTIMTPALYGPDSYMFYKDEMNNGFSEKLVQTLVSPPGVGTTCMNNFNPEKFKCLPENQLERVFVADNKTLPSCKCVENKHVCEGSTNVMQPGVMRTQTTDYLQKLDGYNVNTYLLDTFGQFVDKRFGGWTFETDDAGEANVKVWYNNKGYHAMPGFRNAYSNTLLRSKVTGNKADYGITLYNHPLPYTTSPLTAESLLQSAADCGIAVIILMAFSFIPSALILLSVAERLNNEKQIQSLSGVNSLTYWLSTFMWDMFVYMISVACAAAIVAIIKPEAFYTRENFGAFVVLLTLFGWAILPIMYSTLKLFKSGSSAYLILFCLNMFIGIITIITVLVLLLFYYKEGVDKAHRVLKYLFLIFPQFCLSQGLIDVSTNHFQYKLFLRFGDDLYKDPFSFDLLGYNMVAMAIEGFVFFIITVIIDSKPQTPDRIPSYMLEDYNKEEDVQNEASRVESGQTPDDTLVVNKLTKVFRRGIKKHLAVNNVSFGVRSGECFGLLGVNGAGKTTTFRMLTGDLRPSRGFAELHGKRLCGSNSLESAKKDIGYCPQYGGLDDFLSAEELLLCYARLKGLSGSFAKSVVRDLIGKLDLGKYADKPVKTYSGGNQRKVSLAIAMIGDPDVLFLDEPTTGMDPGTRRLAWKTITKATRSGQAVVLTSHSMDECDHLCNRLAIMVNGQLKCLGSPQHLKNKFGDGYSVTVNFSTILSTRKIEIEQTFINRFPGTIFTEETPEVIEFHIPRDSGSVADLFNILESAQENGQIQEYSLSQTTLDEVFVNFAKEQTDSTQGDDDDASSSSGSSSDNSKDHMGTPILRMNKDSHNLAFFNAAYNDDEMKQNLSKNNTCIDLGDETIGYRL